MRGGPNRKRGNWGRELNNVLVFREQRLQNPVCKESFVFVCLTTVHEFYGLKASQMSKVRASSHKYPDAEEIKNLREQNFKGHSTKRLQWLISKLNSRVKYPDSFICFRCR